MNPKRILSLVSIAAGAVLAIFFWNLHVYWFQGGPIGLVLIGLGALDLFESRRSRASEPQTGILQELRNDIIGPPRNSPSQQDSPDRDANPRDSRAGDDEATPR